MDFNHHNPTNTSCELHHHHMPMDDHILHDHDQLPLHLLWPDHSLDQTHHLSSPISSTQFPNVALFDSQDPEKHQQEREEEEREDEVLGAMKEMMFKIAAMQPVDIDPASIRRPKRRNVRISNDPQSVAARLRRERISERMRILQRLVPGGAKMDTATMLDEAIRYVKFLKKLIRQLQSYPLHPLLAGDLPADWPSSSHPPPGPGNPPIHGN